jgi:hypothetical protein
VLLILLGWLIPLRTFRALERDRDHWREVAIKAIGHTDELMPAARIASQVTQAFANATHAEDTAQQHTESSPQ